MAKPGWSAWLRNLDEGHGCLDSALGRLVHDGCLENTVHTGRLLPSGGSQLVVHPPAVYIAHARRLHHRRRLIETRLQMIGPRDVTFVLCADSDEVARLSPVQRHCLHPAYARTSWSPAAGRLSNGTLSLALKHRLAHRDILHRKLSAALVIEDDALLPSDIWTQLARFRIPSDADLFFLGSYSKNPNPRMTLSASPHVRGTAPAVHKRNRTAPFILGTVAYIVFARGAAALQRPIAAEVAFPRWLPKKAVPDGFLKRQSPISP